MILHFCNLEFSGEKLTWDDFYQFICTHNNLEGVSYVYKGILYEIASISECQVGYHYKYNIGQLGYYIFYRYTVLTIKRSEISEIECYTSLKDTIDNSKTEDGKTLKEIFGEPDFKLVYPHPKKIDDKN